MYVQLKHYINYIYFMKGGYNCQGNNVRVISSQFKTNKNKVNYSQFKTNKNKVTYFDKELLL